MIQNFLSCITSNSKNIIKAKKCIAFFPIFLFGITINSKNIIKAKNALSCFLGNAVSG